MKFYTHRVGQLKIIKKIFHSMCNIGTEGTVDCFLAATIPQDKHTPSVSVVLAIFIPRYEGFTLDLVTDAPASEDEATVTLNEILQQFKQKYLEISQEEKIQSCSFIH